MHVNIYRIPSRATMNGRPQAENSRQYAYVKANTREIEITPDKRWDIFTRRA